MKLHGGKYGSSNDRANGAPHRSPAGPGLGPLIAAARRGGSESFDALFATCRDYLLAVANDRLDRALRARVAPSSLVQDTLMQAHEHFERFRGQTERELLAWLRVILENNIKEAWRFHAAQKRDIRREVSLDGNANGELLADLADNGDMPDAGAIQDDNAIWLARGMRRLSEEHRAAIDLRKFHGRSFAEIGRQLDRSEGAARSLYVRAIRRLAIELGADHDKS